MSPKHIARTSLFILMLSVGIAGAPMSSAYAQTTDETAELSATPKGSIGLGLIGAELGTMIPAWAGMTSAWGYVVFPLVGGAGGAVAGYYLLDSPDQTTWSVVALAAGMAMVIPTIVIALSASAYDPDDSHTAVEIERLDDMAGPDEVESGGDGVDEFDEASREPSLHEQLAGGAGLVRRVAGEWQLGVPGVSLQLGQLRSEEGTAYSVSLISGAF